MSQNTLKILKRYNHLIGEIDAVYHEMSMKLELSDSAMRILYTVYSEGDVCSLRTVCHLSGLSKQTVNSALRKLERQGIVYLQSVDSKKKNVCLTEDGKKLAERTAGRVMEVENDIFSSWTDAEAKQYLELTERFLVALKEKAEYL